MEKRTFKKGGNVSVFTKKKTTQVVKNSDAVTGHRAQSTEHGCTERDLREIMRATSGLRPGQRSRGDGARSN